MAEGAVDLEAQPIVSKLFPIRRESVLKAFEELSPKDPSNASKFEEEKNTLRDTNPYAADSIEEFLGLEKDNRGNPKKNAEEIYKGYLILYRALRIQASPNDSDKLVELPILTKEYFVDYTQREDKALEDTKIERKEELTFDEGGRMIRIARVNKLRKEAPELSTAVEEQLGGSGWVAEYDPVYEGIIDAYFMFSEGLKDPKNFQQ